MRNLFAQLWNDEQGFIVSAELVLVGTLACLSMIVGLAEVSNSINNELRDIASAFDSVNQSYDYGDSGWSEYDGGDDSWDIGGDL